MFDGEMMNCCYCGFSQQSDPDIESGWLLSVVGKKQKYICPGCAPMIGMVSAPKCETCGKYFDPKYDTCPHCEKSGIIESIKSRMLAAMEAAKTLDRFPVFVIKENLLDESVMACKQLKEEFEKRGVHPVLKLDPEDVQSIIGQVEMIAQIIILAQSIATATSTDKETVMREAILEARKFISNMYPNEIGSLINHYKEIFDSTITKPSPNLN